MRSILRWLTLGLVLLHAVLCPTSDTTVQAQTYSDEFNSPTLDPKWTFENLAPNPDEQSWSLTSNPGFLTMTTTGPTDIFWETNTSPRMIQAAPASDFVIVARVLASPDVAFEHAGVLVIESPTSWVRLIRDYLNNGVNLQTGPGAAGAYFPYTGSDIIVRLTREGSTYTGEVSIDGGNNFEMIGQVQGPSYPVSIGTTIASTPQGNVFTASFDYFRVTIPDAPPPPPPVEVVPSLTPHVQVLLVLALLGTMFVVWRRLSA